MEKNSQYRDASECSFCFNRCLLKPGKTGICGVRSNIDGTIVSTVYGLVISLGIDPIEKKPLYHLYPGSRTLSVALPGCNLKCSFCQNHSISQVGNRYANQSPEELLYTDDFISPGQLVSTMQDKGLNIMTYTYSDPVVWQDYMLDTARLVRKQPDGVNCMVTNGTMTPESLESMQDVIDAYNIDVKGDDHFYRTYCRGRLSPVLDSIGNILKEDKGIVEVTTLVIEGIHTIGDIANMGSQLHEIGVQVWHLSRFYPSYRMSDRKATSEAFLGKALLAAADSGIPHIYSGNSVDTDFIATICPDCGKVLIPSHGFSGEAARSVSRLAAGGACSQCGRPLYGLFC